MENSDGIGAELSTPGSRLRKAREEAGISPREMADRLNWLPAHVGAIEEDRFDELRSSAFIKGYLRAYARSVGLDEDEIVALYTAMQPEQSDTPAPVVATPTSHAQGQKTGWSVVFGTAVAVVVIAGIWWAQQAPAPAKPDKPLQPVQTATPERLTPEAAAPETAAESTAARDSEVDTPDDIGVAEEAVPVVQAEALAPAAVEAASPVEQPEAEVAVEETPDIEEESPAPAVVAVAEAEQAISPALTGPGQGLLEFTFSDDCWLEVRDGDDQLIYADLHGAGDVINLDGKPPFQVLAGNAAAITLSFRGEPVAVVTRPGRDTARFSVGEP